MNYSPEIQKQIQAGRLKFVSMSTTYLMGVFNDNFFKEVAILLAFAAGLSELQSPIIKYFSLPFILFSAYAGFFADKFPKRNVVIFSKYIELAAILIGAAGILTLNFYLIIAMVFMMALQSTLFSPALNGSIPELYPEEYVSTANAIIKMVTTISIIMGIVSAGFALDQIWFKTQIPFGRLLAVCITVFVAIAGLCASYGVKKTTVPKQNIRFPFLGPIDSAVETVRLRKDPQLLIALSGCAFFYFTSTLVLAILHELCLVTMGFSNSATSTLTGALAIGVAVGAIIAAKLSSKYNWQQLLPPSGTGFGLFLVLAANAGQLHASMMQTALFFSLMITGLFGGIFLIPLITFIQVRPAAHEKGKIIGVCNFLDFSGIYLAGEMFGFINSFVSPPTFMALTGFFAVLVACIYYVMFKKEKYNVGKGRSIQG